MCCSVTAILKNIPAKVLRAEVMRKLEIRKKKAVTGFFAFRQ